MIYLLCLLGIILLPIVDSFLFALSLGSVGVAILLYNYYEESYSWGILLFTLFYSIVLDLMVGVDIGSHLGVLLFIFILREVIGVIFSLTGGKKLLLIDFFLLILFYYILGLMIMYDNISSYLFLSWGLVILAFTNSLMTYLFINVIKFLHSNLGVKRGKDILSIKLRRG
ncbi:MAG TPA: hypothetical protein ENN64_00690 [bacterium]|nr:hypothetical protein [bacterium]